MLKQHASVVRLSVLSEAEVSATETLASDNPGLFYSTTETLSACGGEATVSRDEGEHLSVKCRTEDILSTRTNLDKRKLLVDIKTKVNDSTRLPRTVQFFFDRADARERVSDDGEKEVLPRRAYIVKDRQVFR
jgi:hypothetical protein